MISMNTLRTMRRPKRINKILREILTKALDMRLGVFADQHHLSDVGFALNMAFEPVLVWTLFFARLAVPSKIRGLISLRPEKC